MWFKKWLIMYIIESIVFFLVTGIQELEFTMRLISGLAIAFIVASLFSFQGCQKTSDIIKRFPHDTLFTTYTAFKQTKFRWVEAVDSLLDTVYSDKQPPLLDTIAVPLGKLIAHETILHSRTTPFLIKTATRFQDHPSANDTIFVSDTIEREVFLDSTTVSVGPVTFLHFLKTHKPYFSHPDTIRSIFDTVQEGFRFHSIPDIRHYLNDSATLSLKNAPPFITIQHLWNSRHEKPYDFYRDTASQEATFAKTFSPIILCAPDSKNARKTYHWQLVVENRFALRDTLPVSTYVKPYPYHLKKKKNTSHR